MCRESSARAREVGLSRWFVVDEVRLDGKHPDSEIVVAIREGEGVHRELRHRIWELSSDGSVVPNADKAGLDEIQRTLSGQRHDPAGVEQRWFAGLRTFVARMQAPPRQLQARVEIGEPRLEGSYPETEVVLPVLAGEHGPADLRDRLWREPPGGGEPIFNPEIDWHLVLMEIRGPRRPPPQSD